MRDLRNRRKVKDIAEGTRDSEGKVIRAKLDSLSMINRKIKAITMTWLCLPTIYALRPLERQRKRKTADTNAEIEAHTQSRTRKNWFHPHIWPAIDQAARKTNFSPRETVTYLQSRHRNTSTYDTLSPSTVHNWIDRTKPKRK